MLIDTKAFVRKFNQPPEAEKKFGRNNGDRIKRVIKNDPELQIIDVLREPFR
jgi:hypothetical protein